MSGFGGWRQDNWRKAENARKRNTAWRATRTRHHNCTQTRIFNLKPCKERDAKTKELVNTRKERDEAQAGDSET